MLSEPVVSTPKKGSEFYIHSVLLQFKKLGILLFVVSSCALYCTTGAKKRKSGSNNSSPGASNSRLTDSTPAPAPAPTPALGMVAEKKVNSVDTVKHEISKALKGLPVRKQYETDQVLEMLRIRGIAHLLTYYEWYNLLPTSTSFS
jgi:hypothetical protein